ncbi:peroxiredoxin family protein [Nocardia sp. NBC_01503]|uniref:peroxiredoxin family protein n=1 Tax=Nocardia sp. NBC_01503 TaxID=2975997 RepID=UPI002E7B1F8C|nr:redoxin domain-containing protein [Nocardia sp. NBC_01503]WTL32822.1 peroxiredoxin family protein [Nocardia sp. NBC_01503]
MTVQLWQGSALRRLRRERGVPVPTASTPSQLPIGSLAPGFTLPAALGTPASLRDLLASGHPQILLFLHHGCGPCRQLADELASWTTKLDGRVDLTVIGSGTLADNALWSEEYGLTRYLVQEYREVADRYAVRGTPTAIEISSDGRIATGQAFGTAAIRTLLESATG